MKILVLLSGGIDSAVILAAYKEAGHDCTAVGFDYNQPHHIELDHAEMVADYYKVPFERWGLPQIPKVNDVVFAGRNLVLAAMAISIAQARGADAIAIGCNASDWMRFPDCRPPFWQSVKEAAVSYGIEVLTPLVHHPKSEVVAQARKLGVPIDLTWSCYEPINGKPCGKCLACRTKQEALSE